ncbi:MAG: hypothetical protein CMH98_04680 [Oceanospirillaceae bacterium]|nr:hypothetical protein [Oceanospirillaceae bacterium]
MIEQYIPETWVTGSEPMVTVEGKLAAGLTVAKYTPLGLKKSTGEFHVWDPAATDGTEVAVRLAPAVLDSTGGAVSVQLIKAGTFNPDLVAWPGAATDVQKACAFVGTPIGLQLPG